MTENDRLDLEYLRHVRDWQDWLADRLKVEQEGWEDFIVVGDFE